MNLRNSIRTLRKTVNRVWRRWKLKRDLDSKKAGDQVADLFNKVEEEVDSESEFKQMLSESDSLRELKEPLDDKKK